MQITDASGATHNINPANISAITGQLSTDAAGIFRLHGLFGVIVMSGTVATFVSGLSNAANMVQLQETVNNQPAWFNALRVTNVRSPGAHSPTGTGALVCVGKTVVAVNEAVAACVTAIVAAGGSI
jgi:hypothetical protein